MSKVMYRCFPYKKMDTVIRRDSNPKSVSPHLVGMADDRL